MRQQDLADAAGVQLSTIDRLEREQRNAHALTARALASALGTTLDVLLAGPPEGWQEQRQRVRKGRAQG